MILIGFMIFAARVSASHFYKLMTQVTSTTTGSDKILSTTEGKIRSGDELIFFSSDINHFATAFRLQNILGTMSFKDQASYSSCITIPQCSIGVMRFVPNTNYLLTFSGQGSIGTFQDKSDICRLTISYSPTLSMGSSTCATNSDLKIADAAFYNSAINFVLVGSGYVETWTTSPPVRITKFTTSPSATKVVCDPVQSSPKCFATTLNSPADLVRLDLSPPTTIAQTTIQSNPASTAYVGLALFQNLYTVVACSQITCFFTSFTDNTYQSIQNSQQLPAPTSGSYFTSIRSIIDSSQNLLVLSVNSSSNLFTSFVYEITNSGSILTQLFTSIDRATQPNLPNITSVVAVAVSPNYLISYQLPNPPSPISTSISVYRKTPCHPSCLTCSGPEPIHCLSCSTDSPTNGQCYSCTAVSNCLTFNYLNTVQCLSCLPSLYLSSSNQTCASCGAGYFLDSSNTCRPCDPNCLTCIITSTQCSSCVAGQYISLENNTCTDCNQNSNYFVDSADKCSRCNSNCATCTNSATTCSSCTAPLVLASFSQSCVKCGVDRLDSFVAGNGLCELCDTNCKTCQNSPASCLTCNSGLFISETNHTCVACLDPGFTVDLARNFCMPCSQNCRTCKDSPSACLSCNSGTYLYPQNSTCGPCNGSSETVSADNLTCQVGGCSTPSQCLICNPGYLLVGSVCEPCTSPCAECASSKNNCTRCLDPSIYLLTIGGSNVCDTCNTAGLIVIDESKKKCGFCDANCTSCQSTPTTCTSCGLGFTPVASVCLPCHASCKTCNGTSISQCLTCSPDRALSADGTCHKLCPINFYYDFTLDSCNVCNADCAECSGQSEFDCLACSPGKFLLSSGKCAAECPPRTFIINGNQCSPCHSTCQSCTASSPTSCLQCLDPLFMAQDNSCRDACEQRWFADASRICRKCHPSCEECSGTSQFSCTSCADRATHFLSSTGQCVDCLNDPDSNPGLCFMNQPVILRLATGRAINANASTSVRISFINESRHMSRLSTQLYLSTIKMSISGMDPQAFRREVVFREGQAILDLYFGKDASGSATLTGSVDQHSVVLKRTDSEIAELIWRRGSSSLAIVLSPAPSLEAIQTLQTAFSSSDKVLQGAGTATPIFAAVSLFSAGGMAEPLMKFFKIFKMASRLRLINIDFGVYLEMFLSACNNVFKIGGDETSSETVRANPQTRGKLDQYRVTVLASQAVPLQLAVYWLMLTVRFYRLKIRTYAEKTERLTTGDLMLNTMAESGRVLLLTVVGIDLFFYSARCLNHLNKQMQWRTTETVSFWMAVLTLLVIPADFAVLIASNANCCFSLLRLKMRRQRVLLNRLKKGFPDKEEDTENPNLKDRSPLDSNSGLPNQPQIQTKKNAIFAVQAEAPTAVKQDAKAGVLRTGRTGLADPSFEPNSTGLNPVLDATNNPGQIDSIDPESNTTYFRMRQESNLSLEQFFGNGIKLHKLRTSAHARYFNSVSLIKLFAFEPLYVSLQLLPTTQIVLLCGLQLAYAAWMAFIGIGHKVFESKLMYSSALLCEVALCVFMLVGLIFQLGGGEKRYSLSVRQACQFGAMAFMGLSCVVGLVELVVSLALLPINYFKNRKLIKYQADLLQKKEERGLVRQRRVFNPPSEKDLETGQPLMMANQSSLGQAGPAPTKSRLRTAKSKLVSRRKLHPLLQPRTKEEIDSNQVAKS